MTDAAFTRPVVLLVEDDVRHVELFQLGFDEVGLDAEVVAVRDACAAQAALVAVMDSGADISRWLVLLDLNLPGMSGLDLLTVIRSDSRLDALTVVMLTTSSRPSDMLECAARGADGYVVKPMTYQRLLDEIATFGEMWLGCTAVRGSS